MDVLIGVEIYAHQQMLGLFMGISYEKWCFHVLIVWGYSHGDTTSRIMGYIIIYILVGGFNHLEKYEFVNGKNYPIYYGK